MFKRKQAVEPQANQPLNQLPVGWHDGMLSSVIIRRRMGRQVNDHYYPSGWDLVDHQTGQVMSEFNDETAPPTHEWKVGQRLGIAPQDGNELGEMFKEIYRICYETTLESMKLMGSAIPEHWDAEDGAPIAQIVIAAYTRLPETIKMTEQQAYNATQPF